MSPSHNARILHKLALDFCESYLNYRVVGPRVQLPDGRLAEVHAQNTMEQVCTIWVPWTDTGFAKRLKSTPHIFVCYDSSAISAYFQDNVTDDDYKMQVVGRDQIALTFDKNPMRKNAMRELAVIKGNDKMLREFQRHSNARCFNLESTHYSG